MLGDNMAAMIRRDSIATLDAEEIDALATDIEREARHLRIVAAERRERAALEATARAQVDRLRGIPGMVLACLNRGDTFDIAAHLIARSMGVPEDTVRLHWRNYQRAEKRAAILARDLRILEYARLGMSNAEIARAVPGVTHPNSVTRILRRLIAARSAPPPAPPANTAAAAASCDTASPAP